MITADQRKKIEEALRLVQQAEDVIVAAKRSLEACRDNEPTQPPKKVRANEYVRQIGSRARKSDDE